MGTNAPQKPRKRDGAAMMNTQGSAGGLTPENTEMHLQDMALNPNRHLPPNKDADSGSTGERELLDTFLQSNNIRPATKNTGKPEHRVKEHIENQLDNFLLKAKEETEYHPCPRYNRERGKQSIPVRVEKEPQTKYPAVRVTSYDKETPHFIGLDGIHNYRRKRVDHHWGIVMTVPPAYTGDLNYLFRGPPCTGLPPLPKLYVGSVGWGVEHGFRLNAKNLLSNHQIKRDEFRMESNNRASYIFRNTSFPGG